MDKKSVSEIEELNVYYKGVSDGFDAGRAGIPLHRNRSLEFKIAAGLLIISCTAFLVHFLFFRHSFPPINVDEASFFSPAKSFATKGDLASDIHKSFLPGAENYTYWMPPLYIVLLGGFFKIFGITVLAAKILSVILSCATAILLVSLAKERFTKATVALLFIICPFVIITSAFIRVEALAIFLTVLGAVGVRKGWHNLTLGMIAALGIMTHPLMLACAAGMGLIALKRGIKPLLLFSLGFALAISPYVWYILQDFTLFKEQMTLQFLRKAKASLFDLQPMYLAQSIPMVLLALFALYRTRAENTFRLFLTISMLLALVIILRSNEFNYQVYLVPYVVAAIILSAEQKAGSPLFRWAIPLLLYGFFAGLLFFKLGKYKFRTDDDFNQMANHLNNTPLWKGKSIFAAGGPDLSTYLLMKGEDVERQIPVPQTLPSTWFDKYNHVIEVRENLSSDENVFEESGKPRPWQNWKAVSFTTTDSAYTVTQYLK